MTDVVVTTDSRWTSAVDLYLACGFVEVARDGSDTHFVKRRPGKDGRRLKLFLMSSCDLGASRDSLHGLLRRGARAALIFNALDQYRDDSGRLPADPSPDREPNASIAALASLGVVHEELDLRDYFTEGAALRARLGEFDLVWVSGGNTFVLARAMKASGFGSAAAAALESGHLVYAGYSAGACVTGPDLRGVELMDDASVVPPGYPATKTPPPALGWVPWRIVPHWRPDGGEPSATAAAEHLAAADLEFRPLSDGDAITFEREE